MSDATPPDQADVDNAEREEFPNWHRGAHGRHPRMPSPPGSNVDRDVITDASSKQVMLRAERKDDIEITLVVGGKNRIPKKYTVIQRTHTYYGPKLMLHAEFEGQDLNYQLTCPGPNTQLILWRSFTGVERRWRNGWIPIAEVTARITDTKQYRLCDECGEPIKGIWHERMEVFGIDHDEAPKEQFQQ